MADNKLVNGEVIDVNQMVDFTLLDARATDSDIEKLCDIAYKNHYYSVCVNPCNVGFACGYIKTNLNDAVKVAAVVGFPLGANSIETKCFEAKECLENGADEIDMVINIGKIKQGKWDYLKDELVRLRKTVRKHVLKVIIETCYLDKNEIVKISKLCVNAKVDYVKTSTGFGTAGADSNDVKLISETLRGACKIKASGGIRTREKAVEMINAGASRIGTSHIL